MGRPINRKLHLIKPFYKWYVLTRRAPSLLLTLFPLFSPPFSPDLSLETLNPKPSCLAMEISKRKKVRKPFVLLLLFYVYVLGGFLLFPFVLLLEASWFTFLRIFCGFLCFFFFCWFLFGLNYLIWNEFGGWMVIWSVCGFSFFLFIHLLLLRLCLYAFLSYRQFKILWGALNESFYSFITVIFWDFWLFSCFLVSFWYIWRGFLLCYAFYGHVYTDWRVKMISSSLILCLLLKIVRLIPGTHICSTHM